MTTTDLARRLYHARDPWRKVPWEAISYSARAGWVRVAIEAMLALKVPLVIDPAAPIEVGATCSGTEGTE